MSAEFCHLCGKKILGLGTPRLSSDLPGRARSFRHKKWPRELALWVCEDCIRQKPRCRICDLPMAAPTPNGACATCNQYLRLCLACGQEIKGRYYEFDAVGPYCKQCVKGGQRRPCDVCGAPLTDEQWQLSDGRIICAYCHATAIYAPADATILYEEMKAEVAKRLDLRLNVPTGLALVDRNQLRQVIHKQRQKTSAGGASAGNSKYAGGANGGGKAQDLDPECTLGIYARKGMRRSIYVQTGLPRLLFLQVAAHEYAHAWQGENCPVLSDALVHEGFAEWVAYHVMGHYGYTQGQERMLARQDIYGRGLRWALEVEASQSASGVILACRRSM
ncbi:MAG: hypothetical protein JXA78_07075 [Anaerolineales bacterium]|nr:hypothetical protein [Anaerolineales bacterium]